jgi:hypothetical protein
MLSSVMKKDVEFLSSHGLMDYSMLLAIETESEHLEFKDHRKFRDRKESVRLANFLR